MVARGFYPDRYHAYGLDRNDRRLYLSDVEVLRTFAIDGTAGAALEDKLLFESMMPPRARVPRTVVLVRDGRPVWFADAGDRGLRLDALTRRRRGLFSRPRFGLGGEGAQLLEFTEGSLWRNGTRIESARLTWETLGDGEIVVSEVVRQGRFAASLFDRVVNTVRAITMLDPDDGRPFIVGAVLKVGTAESFPVDNVSVGAVFCNIDMETGRLGRGVPHHCWDEPLRFIDHHPDTGVVFQEQTIPGWRGVTGEILEVAAGLPGLPYIAWDVALMDDGVTFIEGNRWSDLSSLQLARPLLADERVRRFFTYHGVVTRRSSRGRGRLGEILR
jgi:hypothetical protein